ncbi:CAP domain-containing protein [Streptomyces sp. TRM64462]|uniref:CAP domain-containing protein n=1 Tax=Streptomyces sp. TRM64462 TaxID=2741726 RepID=UPI001586A22E|nr:CAP domain-containing protein [Streptomyces sp. TRM64462]
MQHHHRDDHHQHEDQRGQGRHRTGRRAAAPAARRHAKRRWTYQGVGTIVAGSVAVAAVATGTLMLGGTGGEGTTLATRTATPDAGRHDTAGTDTGTGPSAPEVPPAAPSASTSASAPRTAPASPSGSTSPTGGPSASAGDPSTGAADPDRPAGGLRASERPTADAPAPAAPLRTDAPEGSATPRTPQTPRPAAAPGGAAAEHIRRVVDLANTERSKAGCPALRVNSRLQSAAQSHADDMAARNYYEHDTPEGRDAGDRMRSAGYRWMTWGENIHRGPKDPVTAMRDWMNSPGHRKNILNCKFKDIGVGVNLKSNGPWWVQNFGAAG